MGITICKVKAKDGTEIIEFYKEDKAFRMNSLYRPYEEAARFAARLMEEASFSIRIVFGFGNGIIPEAVVKECDEHCVLVFYEPFGQVLDYADGRLENLLSNKQVDVRLVADGRKEHDKICPLSKFSLLLEEIITYSNYRGIQYIALPKYIDLFPDEYYDFEKKIKYRINKIKNNIDTARSMGHDAVVNNIFNLRQVIEGYCLDSFYNIFKDSAAIIVSAGPSLKKNVSDLKLAKGNIPIICVDTAVSFLLKNDITPDFIVCVDAVKPTALFDEVKKTKIPLICCLDTNYKVLGLMKDSPIIMASTDSSYVQGMYRMYGHDIRRLRSGGSVATFAFSVCQYMGCKTIILVGQDLALEGDQLYVDGIQYANDSEREIVEIEGIDGKHLETYRDYYTYLLWFEQMIELYPELNVVDATEGGAKIRGSKIMRLREIIKCYADQHIESMDLMRKIEVTFTAEQKRMLYQSLKNSYFRLLELKKILKKGIEIAEGAERKKGEQKNGSQDAETVQYLDEICKYYNSLEEGYFIQREIDATQLEKLVSLFENGNGSISNERYRKIREYFNILLLADLTVINIWKWC